MALVRIRGRKLCCTALTLALVLPAQAGAGVASAAQDNPRYDPIASAYLPLDSWVYPALERLVALGYAPSALAGLKPWTRIECARLVEESGENLRRRLIEDRGADDGAAALYVALEREFAFELEALGGGRTTLAHLESAYVRLTHIRGTPLTDAFHFGQTMGYEFGRSFRSGSNAIAGASASFTAGRLAVYVRGEFQHAPAAPPLPDAALDVIALRDNIPRPAAAPFAQVNRAALLDTYVAFNLANWQFSAGKHSFQWGPGTEGSLLLSANAEPMYMLRASRTVPFRLPGFLRRIGPIRSDVFLARPEGHQVIPRPLMFGQKVSFKPKPWIEAGLGRIITLGGVGGDPFTLGNFLKAYAGLDRASSPTDTSNPGDERNVFDVTIYLPGSRAVFYVEAFTDDTHALAHPTWAVWRPGIYIPRLPWLSQMDLRLEAVTSETPGDIYRNVSPGRPYWNFEYRDGHTNKGVLMGNTVGRMGRAVLVRTNYWLSPRQRVEFFFRNSSISREFLPGGAHWRDFRIGHEIFRQSGLYLRSSLQHERISRHPVLFAGRRSNTALSVEIGFWPERPPR